MKTRTLHCEPGNHDWEAPSQRGRVPKACPQCRGGAKPLVIKEHNPQPEDTLDQKLMRLTSKRSEPLLMMRITVAERDYIKRKLEASVEPMARNILDKWGV